MTVRPRRIVHRPPRTQGGLPALGTSVSAQRPRARTDLPGFGSSTRTWPDYSFRAHAVYVRQLLDQLGIQRAHLLGLSMGGGVALSLLEVAPQRVATLRVSYAPVVAYLACLMVKHRSATLFTAANPAILAGGFAGESKYDILQGLAGAGEYVARASPIEGRLGVAEKVLAARRFMADERLKFPIVLKPNNGQRGSGVIVVRSTEVLNGCLERSSVDTIIQEHVTGAEFGVFHVRAPDRGAWAHLLNHS